MTFEDRMDAKISRLSYLMARERDKAGELSRGLALLGERVEREIAQCEKHKKSKDFADNLAGLNMQEDFSALASEASALCNKIISVSVRYDQMIDSFDN